MSEVAQWVKQVSEEQDNRLSELLARGVVEITPATHLGQFLYLGVPRQRPLEEVVLFASSDCPSCGQSACFVGENAGVRLHACTNMKCKVFA